jgi:hypothetical protein
VVVGRSSCGCITAAMVVRLSTSRELAQFVADLVSDGRDVSTETYSEANPCRMGHFCWRLVQT